MFSAPLCFSLYDSCPMNAGNRFGFGVIHRSTRERGTENGFEKRWNPTLRKQELSNARTKKTVAGWLVPDGSLSFSISSCQSKLTRPLGLLYEN